MWNGDKLKEQSYSNIKTVELNNITRTIVSWYAKSVDFIVNYLKSWEFYDSLNKHELLQTILQLLGFFCL